MLNFTVWALIGAWVLDGMNTLPMFYINAYNNPYINFTPGKKINIISLILMM